MAFVRKMENGAPAPTLYTWYGKQYDFDEMQRQADAGLIDYLGTLRRGRKNETELRQAYLDLMTGIKNGTITFRDGLYVDSTGHYDNTSEGRVIKNKNKDYYGLMANYIYGILNRLTAYEAPEDKTRIKWNGNTGVGLAVSRYLYNSDNGNIQDFIDRDKIDEKTKLRGTNNRILELISAYLNTYDNFDNLFTGYTPSEKSQAQLYLSQAISELLKDGLLDSDYLALSRAAGGLDYRNMFTIGTSRSQSSVSLPGTSGGSAASTNQTGLGPWLDTHYPQFNGQLQSSRTLVTPARYGELSLLQLNKAIQGLSNDDLTRITRSIIADQNYTFYNEPFLKNYFTNGIVEFDNRIALLKVLEAMKSRNMLSAMGTELNPMYYIVGTAMGSDSSKLTGWIWDPTSNSLINKSIHDIPYWLNKILKEYLASNTSLQSSHWATHPVYSQYLKEGGILKGLDGLVFSKTPENSAYRFDWNDNSLDKWFLTIYDTETKLKNLGEDSDASVGRLIRTESSDKGNTDDHYNFNIGGANLETLPYYQRHLSFLKGDDELSKKYRELYFAHYKKYQNIAPTIYQLMFKDGVYNDEIGKKFATEMIGNYGKIANDLKNGVAHDVYKPILYTFRDKEASDGYITNLSDNWQNDYEIDGEDKDDAENFRTIRYLKRKAPVVEDPKPDGLPKSDGQSDDSKDGTRVNPTGGDPKKKGIDWNKLNGAVPDLLGGLRLGMSLAANNRIAKTVRESLNPALINPDERFSPVTGAFSEMLHRNKQAADITSRMSQPFTSDASLQLAGLLDANRRATELQHQGFLADDKEIKRTAAEALARREWTHTNHINVANENAKSINQTVRERAQLEATRQKLNWLSWDNFIKGIEDRTRAKYDARETEMKDFQLKTKAADIDQRYKDAIRRANTDMTKWLSEHNGLAIENWSGYDNYSKLMEEMGNWRQALLFGAHASINGYNYSSDYLNMDPMKIAAKYHYKLGGRLIRRKY